MPIYQYKAYAAGGATTTGVIDADTPREARSRLRRDKILVKEIKELKSKAKRGREKAAPKKGAGQMLSKVRISQGATGPKGRDLEVVAGITRQLGTLLNAGIPLADALKAIIDQSQSRRIETVFREIRERITQGASLGDAFAEHPELFSELYVNMVKAGEATGRVDQVLSRLADFMHRQRSLQRKVISALTYPTMMVVLGVVVVSILMTLVVPKITEMLADTGQEMPLPTQILINISDVFKNYWWVGFLAIGLISAIIERVYQTPRGRLFFDRLLLRPPLIGELLRKAAVARFSRTLSTLLSSGVAAVQSLEITKKVVGNKVIADATDYVRARILEGTDIASPLQETGVFPPVVGYMVSVGEKSGELEQMLDRIAEAYDEEIEVVTDRVTTVLEPIMIVFLAGVVGYIVYSIVLPILQVGNF